MLKRSSDVPSMCLIIALAVLGTSLALGDCSRPDQAAYAMPLPSPRLSHDKGKLGEPSSYPEGFETHKRKPGSPSVAF